MTEARPRLLKGEIRFLVRALSDREEALKALYETRLRTIVAGVAAESRWIDKEQWQNTFFHNYEIHGSRALTIFRYAPTPQAQSLNQKLKADDSELHSLNWEAWVCRGLRARLESLLAGKRQGRIGLASDMARCWLESGEDKL